MSIHIFNVLNAFGYLDYKDIFNISIVINICALITFLIYRVTAGITKILC